MKLTLIPGWSLNRAETSEARPASAASYNFIPTGSDIHGTKARVKAMEGVKRFFFLFFLSFILPSFLPSFLAMGHSTLTFLSIASLISLWLAYLAGKRRGSRGSRIASSPTPTSLLHSESSTESGYFALIGNTPLIKIQCLSRETGCEILVSYIELLSKARLLILFSFHSFFHSFFNFLLFLLFLLFDSFFLRQRQSF